jgi:signal transduction histidine kinase
LIGHAQSDLRIEQYRAIGKFPTDHSEELGFDLSRLKVIEGRINGSWFAFSLQMQQLFELQQHRLRTAMLQAASCISHDLRNYLAVLLANTEFLYEHNSAHLDKDDIYREIKIASEQMTELIDSLRTLGAESASITPAVANLEDTVKRALDAVEARHPLQHRSIKVIAHGEMSGEFDARKLERVFFNLVLNACEATTAEGTVTVEIVSHEKQFDIRVCDTGLGIPPSIRHTLFEPAVSATKTNNSGFGLAIVKRIVSDHGGSVEVECTSELGTVILVNLPRCVRSGRCSY